MMTLLQTLRQISEQSAIIAEKDPHGITVSVVSIVAVFLSLLVLFLVYMIIGKCVRMAKEQYRNISEKEASKDVTCDNMTAAANIITIRRKPKTMISVKEDISRIGGTGIIDDGTMEIRSTCHESGIVCSPLPGVMIGIRVNAGDKVWIGSALAVLEAMKMENTIESEYDGTVVEIYVSKGDSVLEGTPLMKIL